MLPVGKNMDENLLTETQENLQIANFEKEELRVRLNVAERQLHFTQQIQNCYLEPEVSSSIYKGADRKCLSDGSQLLYKENESESSCTSLINFPVDFPTQLADESNVEEEQVISTDVEGNIHNFNGSGFAQTDSKSLREVSLSKLDKAKSISPVSVSSVSGLKRLRNTCKSEIATNYTLAKSYSCSFIPSQNKALVDHSMLALRKVKEVSKEEDENQPHFSRIKQSRVHKSPLSFLKKDRKGSTVKLTLESYLKPDDLLLVPSLIYFAVKEIERRGMEEEGLYRIPGSQLQINMLHEEFMKRKIPSLTEVQDVHALCSLVKKFLRSTLEESILTQTLRPDFVLSAKSEDEAGVYQAISNLPQANRNTLVYLMLHLQRVVEIPETRMTIETLSKAIGPSIVWFSSLNPGKDEIQMASREQECVLEQLLRLPTDYYTTLLKKAEKAHKGKFLTEYLCSKSRVGTLKKTNSSWSLSLKDKFSFNFMNRKKSTS